ncbi:GPW/gp25 family protein [Acinetobacter sp. ANC 3791]|uniref:GPW/gp25 family protein n=1 Tax=Acinetobacter sp. ANC 3791 TaxID=2529836 RepID=UPI001039A475|nr:GPW/gp25 family protein [Acinetobacter sp. ANC 3791]TCB86301.1 baseplate assembly protein [Acinetobacter sp. ANC 3791]
MMSRKTGLSIELYEHIRQSIQDIVFTPIGSRVMRRSYGSLVFKLLDQPFNDATRLQVMAATATAILTWENRIQLNSVRFSQVKNGRFQVDLDMQLIGSNKNISISIPLNYGSSL